MYENINMINIELLPYFHMSLDMYENIKCIINMINIELLKLMWPRCNAWAFF